MAFPFGGHPNLGKYLHWAFEEHNFKSQSCISHDQDGSQRSYHKVSKPNGETVLIVDIPQDEPLTPSMIAYLDRRLGIEWPTS